MRHQINIEDLQEYKQGEKVLFASSSKEEKKLYITLRGSYEVYHKKLRILETIQANTAVECYNEL